MSSPSTRCSSWHTRTGASADTLERQSARTFLAAHSAKFESKHSLLESAHLNRSQRWNLQFGSKSRIGAFAARTSIFQPHGSSSLSQFRVQAFAARIGTLNRSKRWNLEFGSKSRVGAFAARTCILQPNMALEALANFESKHSLLESAH